MISRFSVMVVPLVVALSSSALALNKPTRQEAKKMLEFLYHGREQGPILSDIQFCESVVEGADNRSICQSPMTRGRSGDSSYLWMEFLLPQGSQDQILVKIQENGVTRFTREYPVTGTLRFWVFEEVPLDRAGKWTVEVSNPRKHPEEILGEYTLNVAR